MVGIVPGVLGPTPNQLLIIHGNADAVKGGFDAAKELIAGVPIP